MLQILRAQPWLAVAINTGVGAVKAGMGLQSWAQFGLGVVTDIASAGINIGANSIVDTFGKTSAMAQFGAGALRGVGGGVVNSFSINADGNLGFDPMRAVTSGVSGSLGNFATFGMSNQLTSSLVSGGITSMGNMAYNKMTDGHWKVADTLRTGAITSLSTYMASKIVGGVINNDGNTAYSNQIATGMLGHGIATGSEWLMANKMGLMDKKDVRATDWNSLTEANAWQTATNDWRVKGDGSLPWNPTKSTADQERANQQGLPPNESKNMLENLLGSTFLGKMLDTADATTDSLVKTTKTLAKDVLSGDFIEAGKNLAINTVDTTKILGSGLIDTVIEAGDDLVTGVTATGKGALALTQAVAAITGEVIDMTTEAGVKLAKATLEKAGMLPASFQNEEMDAIENGKTQLIDGKKTERVRNNRFQRTLPDIVKGWGDAAGLSSDLFSGAAGLKQVIDNEIITPYNFRNDHKAVQAATIREVTDCALDVLDDKVANGEMPSKEDFVGEVFNKKTPEAVITKPGDVIILEPNRKIIDSLEKIEYMGRPDIIEGNKDYLGNMYDAFTDSRESLKQFYKNNSTRYQPMTKIKLDQYDRLKKIQEYYLKNKNVYPYGD